MGEACFCSSTFPTKRYEAHHFCAEFASTHFFPARLKSPFIRNPPSVSRLPLSCAHKGNGNVKSAPATGFGKSKKKVEDDPWEALFQQLEKDLEDDIDDNSDKEITEEDVANFEKELDTLFQDIEDASTDDSKAKLDEVWSVQASEDHVQDDDDPVDKEKGNAARKNNEDDHDERHVQTRGEIVDDNTHEASSEHADFDTEDVSDDDLEEPRTVALQKWQLRKLAAAAELGRRKVNIKSLAAELKLDRNDVIYFLKSPPPDLLMALSGLEEDRDEGEETFEDDEIVSDEDEVNADIEQANDSALGDDLSIKSEAETLEAKEYEKPTYGPRDWYKGKRIKKANILTLQRVYRRTRWPTNTMIESLVQTTHLPRVRVLQWFEEERAKSGVQSPPKQSVGSQKSWKKPAPGSFERLQ